MNDDVRDQINEAAKEAAETRNVPHTVTAKIECETATGGEITQDALDAWLVNLKYNHPAAKVIRFETDLTSG